MGNVLMYTLLMAGITFAIGFFVAFLIKIVFRTIQRIIRVQSEEFKVGMNRVRHINKIRVKNNLSPINSKRSISSHLRDNRYAYSKGYSNDLIDYFYGKS